MLTICQRYVIVCSIVGANMERYAMFSAAFEQILFTQERSRALF